MRFLKLTLTLGLLGFAVEAVRAVSIPIANPSFENPVINGDFNTYFGPNNVTDLPGWTINGSIDQIGTYWQAADGNQSLDMNGYFAAGTISQQVVLPGGATTVSFDLAGNPDQAPAIKTIEVSLLSSGGSQTFTFDVTGRSHGSMGWVLETANFGYLAAGTYTLQFASVGDPNGAYGPALDNVSVISVPDGGTTSVLLGLGLLGVAWMQRTLRPAAGRSA